MHHILIRRRAPREMTTSVEMTAPIAALVGPLVTLMVLPVFVPFADVVTMMIQHATHDQLIK